MIGEDRLREAARTIRRLEHELEDSRRNERRANDRLEVMRQVIAGTPRPWMPPEHPSTVDVIAAGVAKADANPMPRLRWWRRKDTMRP